MEFMEYLQQQRLSAKLAIFQDRLTYDASQQFQKYLMTINQEKPEKEWLINCTKFDLNILKQSPIE